MAVIVRCSCPSLRLNSCDISRLNPTIPAKLPGKTSIYAKSNLGGLLHLSLFKILNDTEANAVLKPKERPHPSFEGKNFVIAFPKFSIRPWVKHVVHHRLPRSCSIYSGSHYTRIVMWEKIYDIGKRLPVYNHIINNLFAHQRLAPSGFPTAFVLATAFMLGFPFEALAETCEADPLSAINMPLLFAIAMVGATVGGLLARQRRGELARLNDQLRQINAALRRQAKIESYAPNLSYVPGRISEKEVIVDSRKHQLITNLKSGKNYLRNQEPDKAFAEFKAALELAQSLGDPTEEKKAARGLGASLQRQGKHREAVKYHSMVLNISEKAGDDSGNTEAYGAIADCYTELGDLEQAGKFYDKYIARLETD